MSATAERVQWWGPLVVGTDVDEAALAVLRRRMPHHLDQIVRERSLPFELAHPAQYATVLVDEELLDNQIPAVTCETTRLQAAHGGTVRVYEGEWQTDISATVRGKHPADTRLLAALYEGAIRRIMLQDAGGEGPIDWIRYEEMRYMQVPGDERRGRYLLKALSRFAIRTNHIVDPQAGPAGPDAGLVDVEIRHVTPPAGVREGGSPVR